MTTSRPIYKPVSRSDMRQKLMSCPDERTRKYCADTYLRNPRTNPETLEAINDFIVDNPSMFEDYDDDFVAMKKAEKQARLKAKRSVSRPRKESNFNPEEKKAASSYMKARGILKKIPDTRRDAYAAAILRNPESTPEWKEAVEKANANLATSGWHTSEAQGRRYYAIARDKRYAKAYAERDRSGKEWRFLTGGE